MKKILVSLFCLFIVNQIFAVSLPRIFSDNMVLEQNAEVPVWGFGKAGEEITVTASWSHESQKTTADSAGKWHVLLKTVGGSYNAYTLTVKGYNTIVYKNILLGEVWFCSGQSNMEMSANWGIDNKDAEIAAADFPNIRFFKTDYRAAEYPQEDLGGAWQPCTPATMQDFSAAGYFFARDLQQKLGVPVGVICSAWGGTYIESWIAYDYFVYNPEIEYNAFLMEGAMQIPPVQWGPNDPAVLYNAMVAPIIPYKIAGVLWYQGEQNTANPEYYETAMECLIDGWRKNWGYDFPFYFAQIAPYNYGKGDTGVQIRNAQLQTAMRMKNTAMIMTSDICTTDDIHPKNKQTVGKRFAETAWNSLYENRGGVNNAAAPMPVKVFAENNKIFVEIANGDNLHFKPKNLNLFEIAGADGKYFSAAAKLVQGKIEAVSRKVKNPVAVRYAWGNSVLPDLFNQNNLPMSSFEMKAE